MFSKVTSHQAGPAVATAFTQKANNKLIKGARGSKRIIIFYGMWAMRHGSMRRHRRGAKPLAEINLTSLLDVTFVLLIAFMIMAPSLKYGVEIDLPGMSKGAPQLTTDQSHLATISITKSMAGHAGQTGPRTFMLDGEQMELDQLETRLKSRNEASGGKLAVEVNADADVPYEAFVQVVGALRRAGIEGVGLPVDTTKP